MAAAEDEVTDLLLPVTLPAWVLCGVTGAAWLKQSCALIHGPEYLARALWQQQQHSGEVHVCGSGDDQTDDVGLQMVASEQFHQDVVRLLAERIQQGMHMCVASGAGMLLLCKANDVYHKGAWCR